MRRRLAVLVAATTSLVLVAFIVPLGLLARTVAADRATADALVAAQSLVPLVSIGDRAGLELTVQQAGSGSPYPLTVFLPGGVVLGAPAEKSDAVELATFGRSVTVDEGDGREIVVAVQGRSDGTAVIRTFVTNDQLTTGVARAWLIVGLLGLTLLGVGLLIADRLARSLVRPMSELARVSHRLAGGDLEARVPISEGTPEVHEIAVALNHLAGRIRTFISQERETVADLSHRLRTPLTALRLESETLRDPAEAARVGAAVESMERMVTQVIKEARRSGGQQGRCDAVQVVTAQIEYWAALAGDQDREIRSAVADGPLPVNLTSESLTTCVDALLENVFAHTPDGTGFSVELSGRPAGGAVLTVRDEGPGMPGAGAVGRGVSGGASTGLGLDIARRTAERSGGSFELRSPPTGGAELILTFGPPPDLH
jgi:signal transduction histidine kinase